MFIPEVDPCSHMESQVLRNLGAELWKVTKEAGQLPLTEHSKEIETDVVGNLMIIKRGLGVIIIIIYTYIYIYISSTNHPKNLSTNPLHKTSSPLLVKHWCWTIFEFSIFFLNQSTFYGHIVDGCEILHHQKDGWNPINNGIFTIYQLVIRISLCHPPYVTLW